MTVSTRIFSSLLLAVFVLSSSATATLAHSIVRNHLPWNLTTWSTYGSPTVTASQITLQGADREWVYVDIDASRIDEAYILLAAYVDKDDTRSNLSSADKTRSGNPYLYAYYLDRNGKVQRYLTGSEVIATTHAGSDFVTYGIFPTISGTKTIRVFLKQSSVKNISNSGVNVSFVKPVLLEAASRHEAREILADFAKIDLSYR
jgi:hypothetical protein